MITRKVPVRYDPAQLAWIAKCATCGELLFMITDEFIAAAPRRFYMPHLVTHNCMVGDEE